VLIVRPRGWHLDEKHVLVDGQPISGQRCSTSGLFCFHNARRAGGEGRGPYFYLPKLQSMEEARCGTRCWPSPRTAWPAASAPSRHRADRDPAGRVRDGRDPARAADHIVGLNCGRWDYIFSYIKTLPPATRSRAAGARW
jgi:malate synthase